jgi:hypothetical protein
MPQLPEPFRWFLPDQMRFVPGTRAISIALRALHLAAFGILLGGHAFGIEAERLLPYLSLTILSGIGLITTEVYAVGLYWFFLGKGLMVLAKLGLLLAVPVFWEQRVALLLVVVVVSIGSHMPARYRHYSLLHRRVIGPEESLRPVPFSSGPAAAAVAGVEEGRREQRWGGPTGSKGGCPKERRSGGHLGPA